MRKKFLSIILVALITCLVSASLIGCGTKAEATDIQITEKNMDEETVAVEDAESVEAAVVGIEDNTDDLEEVAGGAADNSSDDVVYEEHEFFYVRDKLDMTDAAPMDMNSLDVEGKTYTLQDSVNIYAPMKGALMGYTKPNIDVYVNSCDEDWYCLYFENEASPNDYVLVKAEDFIESSGMYEDMSAITADDIKLSLMDQLDSVDYGVDYDVYFIALDEIVEGMDSTVEFTIPTYCRDIDDWMAQIVADNDFGNYKYFYIEKVEEKSDEENSCFRVIYGTLQEYAE